MSVTKMLSGDRRMEAQSYLADGYGIKLGIESKRSGWRRLSELANVWMPGRLKGITVDKENGTPFLAATQVFDVQPIPRKWLSLNRTADAASRFVTSGQILVTCSGAVGRPIVAYSVHENILISHDILRVDPVAHPGWIYAFLNAHQTRAMAEGAQYGHIIKHLETSHLDAIPVPRISEDQAILFDETFARIVSLRDRMHQLTSEAESKFAEALGPIEFSGDGENGFSVKASSIISGRRRIEAAAHNPIASTVRKHLKQHGAGMTSVRDAGFDVWKPTRFKRIPSETGPLLLDTASLGAINPRPVKRIKDGEFGDPFRGRVKAGWILIPRSGQVYGILGTPTVALSSWEEWVVSDHALRLRPIRADAVATGYMAMALGHPVYGRPLVKALAYGSSIPDIEHTDLADLEIVRLGDAVEAEIAALVEAAADARAAADLLEQQIAGDAEEIIDLFTAGKRLPVASRDTQQIAKRILDLADPDA